MVSKALLTSNNQEWETPPELFYNIHSTYNFEIDACATKWNTKLENFWSKEDDAFSQSWANKRVWLNPPYTNEKPSQYDWIAKAFHEVTNNDCPLVMCLLPVRSDTRLFHDYVMKASMVYFIKGRLRFVGAPSVAVFPSMLVLFEASTYKQMPGKMKMPVGYCPTFTQVNTVGLRID